MKPETTTALETGNCPFCKEVIQKGARKCKHCGELIDESLRTASIPVVVGPQWSPGVAAVLSLVIPGAGQMYKGQVLRGIGWLFFTLMGYFLLVPGLILHLFCILGAYSGSPNQNVILQKISAPKKKSSILILTFLGFVIFVIYLQIKTAIKY